MAEKLLSKTRKLVKYLSNAIQDTGCDEEASLSIYIHLQKAASVLMNQQIKNETKCKEDDNKRVSNLSSGLVAPPQVWYRITYSSNMVVPENSNVVEQIIPIINFAVVQNQKLRIGGMLFCDVVDGRVIQVLEGERATVQALYSKIDKDKRHTDVRVLKEETVRERKYQSWGMQFAQSEADWETVVEIIRHERQKGLAREKGVTDFGTLSDDDDEPVSAVQTLGSLSGCSEEKQKASSS
eukprot:CAMPEP_0185261646 /NCGR_PEP_ID=MMETSP1359-20130426/9984_1 /TAXON_ID=552665 /ORGANISM="Bigelowiella longifila, Strain CCMP242" /LENGTH=238 /DNA_ID=CAMNT_0027848337 /DNA_START=107 /DNA_END=823 /DNA_ORIENTATION=+